MDIEFDRLGQLYSELGAAILERFGPGPHHITLYAEAGDMWTGVSVYHDEGERVSYSDGDGEIAGIVLDLWYAEPAGKRWKEMQFDLDGTKFHARNFFADELKTHETYDTRRERAVRERFGDKPVFYPPLPDEDDVPPNR